MNTFYIWRICNSSNYETTPAITPNSKFVKNHNSGLDDDQRYAFLNVYHISTAFQHKLSLVFVSYMTC
jgi:hypothetical protein